MQLSLLSAVIATALLSSPAAANPVAKFGNQQAGRVSKHLRPVLERRATPLFTSGQPDDGYGKGAPLSGGTNKQLDLQNPDNLGQQSTDNGLVVNLKWSFSDSKTRQLNGGWVREQVVTDLPSSHDISSAQQHLKKGAIRELHWHRVVCPSVPKTCEKSDQNG